MNDSHEPNERDPESTDSVMSRRNFMWVAGAGVVAAACGGSDSDDADGETSSGDDSTTTTAAAETESDDSAGSDDGAGEAAAAGGTLRVAFPESPNEFDPALYSAFPEYNTGHAIYDGLVRVDAGLVPQPHLAESWEVTDDGLTWTFNLRSGVMFHHGKEFTADDAAFTIGRLIDEEVGSPLASTLSMIDSAEAVDAKTLQLNLSSPNGDLALLLGAPQARVVPSDRTQDDFRNDPVGTGPFTLVDHIPGDRTTFAANPDYWGAGPFVDGMEFLAMPEATTQVQAISGGQIDIMWQVGAENIGTLDAADGVDVLQVASGAYQTIAMQSDVAPYDDQRVREAVRMCVNREGMLQAVLQGVGSVGNDHPVPEFNPFVADIPLKAADVEGAKALLAEAGYPDGVDLTLTTSTVRAGMVEFATALQAMCEPAGIRITLDTAPPDNYWSEVWLNRPFFASNWGFRPSIDETFSLKYTSTAKWNEGNYFNDDLDAAVAEGRASSDDAVRKAAYGTAQQILHDDGAVIVSYFKPTIQAQRSNVQGYEAHPAQWMYLDEVTLA